MKCELEALQVVNNDLREEMTGLADDRDLLLEKVNHLSVHASKVQTERTLIDDDLSKISEEKIKLKSEAREYAFKLEKLTKEYDTLKSEFDSHLTKSKFDLGHRNDEIERLKHELESVTNELNSEQSESKKQRTLIEDLRRKMDRATHKNAKLKSANEVLEKQLTASVLKGLHVHTQSIN